MQKIEIKIRDGVLPVLCLSAPNKAPAAVFVFMEGILVLRDTPVYDETACERHWRTMTQLFDDVLKGGARAPG
ncbi:hypothetical protein [Taklimakanibacter deserti]|uniref:hypothetical protein n=1 Tax=Taklimakanibacter deserti TaxID=2267839 RepID=UPI000E64DE92